jgi:hypothetical protein
MAGEILTLSLRVPVRRHDESHVNVLVLGWALDQLATAR